jgi:arylsulfatase A-like enzyme
MKQTTKLLQKTGSMLTNWRIHTPICSPSRSETVSGRYFHNIKSTIAVPPPSLLPAATAHINGSLYKNDSFGVHLRGQRGYNVAIFGKSNFNTYEGFDRWFQGACLGYGCSYEDNESPTFHYHSPADEYATALLGNKSIDWLHRDNVSGTTSDSRPFFLYFAPHCPHTPAAPADW